MRVTIQVDRDWKVTFRSEQFGNTIYQRSLRRASDGDNGFFPIPPSDEMPADNEDHYKLCAGDEKAFWQDYRCITERSLKPDTTVRFGRYLFDTLIGHSIWASLLKHAEDSKDRFLELCLSWDSNDAYLHRLNWEMMHGPEFFLFLDRSTRIAISRVPPRTKTIIPRPVGLPPRMLFVIGTSLNDTQIRAGAEYVGLLRQLERNDRRIDSRVLQNASPQRLSEMIRSFQPDVVHFICHGGFNSREGHGYLELELDDREEDRERYAPQLFSFLNSGEQPPSIVVLSACSTANVGSSRILGTHELAPLAAELVVGGIPIVIGMGGEISDLACRLFTIRFGESLLLGEPLVMATTEGRRAAFGQGVAPHTSADWAFPSLFLSEGVTSDFTPIVAGTQNPEAVIEVWIRRYQLKVKPVFCSREDFLDEYYRLLKSRDYSVLVAYVDEEMKGYGRTRLLQQLALNALRDGHVPCLIGSNAGDWRPPRTTINFSVEILRAISTARNALQLEPPTNSVLLQLLKGRNPSEELRNIESTYAGLPEVCFEQMLDCFSGQEFDVAVKAIKQAIEADLAKLIADAREKYPEIIRADSRPLLLLDEVDGYDKGIYPLFNELLPFFYKGDPDAGYVPVVMTMSLHTCADEKLKPIKEKAASRSWIKFKELKKFAEGEDMLAYAQVLLHPFDEDRLPGFSDKPWTFDYRGVDQQIVQRYEHRLRKWLKGIPAGFLDSAFFLIVESAVDDHFLVAADDEIILANERNRA
jgi:hypothetical protein